MHALRVARRPSSAQSQRLASEATATYWLPSEVLLREHVHVVPRGPISKDPMRTPQTFQIAALYRTPYFSILNVRMRPMAPIVRRSFAQRAPKRRLQWETLRKPMSAIISVVSIHVFVKVACRQAACRRAANTTTAQLKIGCNFSVAKCSTKFASDMKMHSRFADDVQSSRRRIFH